MSLSGQRPRLCLFFLRLPLLEQPELCRGDRGCLQPVCRSRSLPFVLNEARGAAWGTRLHVLRDVQLLQLNLILFFPGIAFFVAEGCLRLLKSTVPVFG